MALRDRIKGLKNVPLAKIRGFSGGNPKKRTDTDRRQLGDSLDNHGYVIPIAVRECEDGMYECLDGHGRIEQIMQRDPDAKLKVIVLDVESVAEGRRILLALQHVAPWDMDGLEKFVREALGEGSTAAELMADTGFTGADLEAFASAGSEFLDGVGRPGGAGDEINERGSRAGLVTEHVQFATPLARDQSPDVYAALKLSKQLNEVKVTGDALVAICRFYLEAHKSKEK